MMIMFTILNGVSIKESVWQSENVLERRFV